MQPARRKSAADNSATVFAALGDKRRLRLITRLYRDGPASITALASGSEVSRQATTKHLHVLARAGLVRAIRQGRETIYEPDPAQLHEATRHLESISRQWDQALARLKHLVEDENA